MDLRRSAFVLILLLLLVANQVSFAKILNLEMIASEIVRALAGSIGLVLCIPLTALISALMYTRAKGPLLPSSDWLKRK